MGHCTLFSVNIMSTSRAQASVSRSPAEAELYAMTQAAVESFAIKRFIQKFKSVILSRDVKIIVKTYSPAGKTMASRLGISRKSNYIELKHLWIQDILSEGIIWLEKVGTHHNPPDVLTKFVQAAVLGQHLPKFNLSKDSSLLQAFKYCSGVEKIKTDSQSREMFRSMRTPQLMHTQFYQEYINKLAVNTAVSVFRLDLSVRFRCFSGSSRVFHSEVSRWFSENQTCIRTTTALRERIHRAKRVKWLGISNQDQLFTQRLGKDVSESQLSTATRRRSFMQFLTQILSPRFCREDLFFWPSEFWEIAGEFFVNFDGEFISANFPALFFFREFKFSTKNSAQNSRPELSAFLSNFIFSNPKCFHADFLLTNKTNYVDFQKKDSRNW